MTYGGGVQIQETDEHLADDPPAYRAEAIAATSHVGFAQNVVPKRRFVSPSHIYRPDFAGGEGLFSQVPCDRLT